MSTNARLIIDRPAPGDWNMGVDESLLLDAAENGGASLRFYGWSEPTLSLGYFQPYADRQKHAASRQCAIVRRQTGGGAILHDRELTYSIALPASHPFTKQADKLYTIVHRAFIDALSPATMAADSRCKLEIREECTEPRTGEEPFLCFQRQARGDVVSISTHGRPNDAASSPANSQRQVWKVLGSAQRRYHGAVLQHGSLLLERSPAAPELPGFCNLSDLTVATEEVVSAVGAGLGEALGVHVILASLPPETQSRAEELANNKYGSPAWTKRR